MVSGAIVVPAPVPGPVQQHITSLPIVAERAGAALMGERYEEGIRGSTWWSLSEKERLPRDERACFWCVRLRCVVLTTGVDCPVRWMGS